MAWRRSSMLAAADQRLPAVAAACLPRTMSAGGTPRGFEVGGAGGRLGVGVTGLFTAGHNHDPGEPGSPEQQGLVQPGPQSGEGTPLY